MKNSKLPIFISIISTIICVLAFIWFSNLTGLQGTLNWHMEIVPIYRILFITLLVAPLFCLLYLWKKNKLLKILTITFSVLFAIIWICAFIVLNCISHKKIKSHNLNILDIQLPLPTNQTNSTDEPILHFAVASDPHWGAETANASSRTKILQNIEKSNYDVTFILGDIVEYGIMSDMYKQAQNDLQKYIPSSKIRIIPGNHDTVVNGLPLFKSTFMNKDDKFYFHIQNDGIHLLFINMLWDESEFSTQQEKWLISELEKIPENETIFVFSHCYVVSSGYFDPVANRTWGDLPKVMERLCPILEKYNVKGHFSGHDHFFEALEKNDVSYFVLGTMGGLLDNRISYTSPYSKYLNNTNHGWADVKIFKDKINVSFLNENGDILYNKQIECTKKN